MRLRLHISAAFALSVPAVASALAPTHVEVQSPLEMMDQVRQPERKPYDGSGPRLLNLGAVFNERNYPTLARAKLVEGEVRIVLTVDALGLPTHCVTEGPPPPPELGGPTCALFLGQARFAPARDRKGRPVAGTYSKTVIWVLEGDATMPLADSEIRTVFSFGKDGAVAKCATQFEGGEKREDNTADLGCAEGKAGAETTNAMLHATDPAAWELLATTRTRVGPDDSWESLGNGPGEHLFSRTGHRLIVAADGTVRSCQPLHPQVIEEQLPFNCTGLLRRKFTPATEAERRVTMVMAIYFRKKTGE